MREKEGVAGYIGCNNGQRENERECERERKRGLRVTLDAIMDRERRRESVCERERGGCGLHWMQ